MWPGVSLDHLVGAGKDRWRHSEAEFAGGFEIDDQLEGSRLLDWQIGRLGAFEDLSGVYAELAPYVGETSSIAHQAAKLDELAPFIDRRNGITGGQRHELC